MYRIAGGIGARKKGIDNKMNNKGFTLLEMVVTFGIIGILLGGVAIIFPQWLNQYTYLKQTAAATEVMDVVASGIWDEMSLSRERAWSGDGISYLNGERISKLPLDHTGCTCSLADDTLVISGQPKIYGAVFDTGFYKDMSVTITMQEEKRSRDDKPVLVMNIEVYSSQGALLASETKTVFYYNPET